MNLRCSNCKSKDIRKRGFRINKIGKKKKYQCYKCKKWFVEDDGFKKMRNKKEIIVRAVHLHNEGLSLFQVKDHLWQHDGVKITREAINRWTKKYSVFLKSSK